MASLRVRALALGAFFGVLPTAPARAADKPTVLVLPYAPLHGDLPQSMGDKVSEQIAAELKGREEFTAVLGGAAPVSKEQDAAAPEQSGDPTADAKASLDKAAELAKKNKF